MGLVALAAVAPARPLAAGRLFALYLLLAGLERFLVEFIRRNDDVHPGLTLPQLPLAMIAGGLIWLAVVRRRHGSVLLPAPPRAAGAAAAV